MIDESIIQEVRDELLQASTELDGAAEVLENQGFARTASVLKTAAKKKREVAAKLFPSLEGK